MDQLRKRRDFLAAAKAERAGVSAFLLQGRDRGDGGNVRIGFTVTKKTGNAVVRNRIRRRLREVARQVVPDAGRPGYDYVLVAREHALGAPFGSLLSDLGKALRKLHDPARGGGAKRGPKSGVKSGPQPASAASRGDDQSRAHPRKGLLASEGEGEIGERGAGSRGASPQGVATASRPTPHSNSTIGSDPQAPSADGGHSA